jgi:tryptophan-rich sensory protein
MDNRPGIIAGVGETSVAGTYVQRPGIGVLIVFVIVATIAAAGISALIVFSESAEWTESLVKPDFALSGLQIGLVWELLFACMAVSYWFIRCTPPLPDRRAASIAFGALVLAILAFPFYAILPQNLLNAFVGTLGSAFIAWVVTGVVFRNSRKAGVMLLPVALWLSFASVIAFHVYRLNPPVDLLGG